MLTYLDFLFPPEASRRIIKNKKEGREKMAGGWELEKKSPPEAPGRREVRRRVICPACAARSRSRRALSPARLTTRGDKRRTRKEGPFFGRHMSHVPPMFGPSCSPTRPETQAKILKISSRQRQIRAHARQWANE